MSEQGLKRPRDENLPPHHFHVGPKRAKQVHEVPAVIDLTSSPETGAKLPPIVHSPPNSASSAPTSKKPKKPKKRKRSSKEPELCAEQQDLVDVILNGRNVFYTGSAGCGKSTVLRAFAKQLKQRGKKVKIVAPTGRAAVDIGGQTIFAFAGLTPDSLKIPVADLKNRGMERTLWDRFNKETDVLVIDEIFMVENHLLERVRQIMAKSRGSAEPFGGVQVVFLGDF